MNVETSIDTGLEVIDLQYDAAFAARRLHIRDVAMQMEGMQRLARAFVESPDTILQELGNAAGDLCGADSAGISIEQENGSDDNFYQWVATAGEYAGFLNATLPRYPSACGMCLKRGRPHHLRVGQPFLVLMGVEAPKQSDGILLPWQVEETRGTIWIVAHGNGEAFDRDDLRMMEVLADFAAMAMRHQRQQCSLLEQASATAAASMANDLAHKGNNPLQGPTNLGYLAAEGKRDGEAKMMAGELSEHIQRMAVLVGEFLALPGHAIRLDDLRR